MKYGPTSLHIETNYTGWHSLNITQNPSQLARMDPLMRAIRTTFGLVILNSSVGGNDIHNYGGSSYLTGTELFYSFMACNRNQKTLPRELKDIVDNYGEDIYTRFMRMCQRIFKILPYFKKGSDLNVPRAQFSMNRFNHGLAQWYIEIDKDLREFFNYLYNVICVTLRGINPKYKQLLLSNAGSFNSSDGRFRSIKMLELLLFYIDTLNTVLTKAAMQYPSNPNFKAFVDGYTCSADYIEDLLAHYDKTVVKHYFNNYAKDPVANDIFLWDLTTEQKQLLK